MPADFGTATRAILADLIRESGFAWEEATQSYRRGVWRLKPLTDHAWKLTLEGQTGCRLLQTRKQLPAAAAEDLHDQLLAHAGEE